MKFLKLKKMGSTLVMALAFCAALFATGCMDQEPVSGEAEAALVTESSASELGTSGTSASEISINAVASFVTICTNAVAGFDPGGSGALVTGKASACKRRNGTWNTVYQHWTGWCTGNLVNCNGWISCDPYCR